MASLLRLTRRPLAPAARSLGSLRSLATASAPAHADWAFPVPVRFGAGRTAELGAVLAERGARRPLLVTDRGLAHTPLAAELMTLLRGAGHAPALFGDVPPNPTDASIARGAAAFAAHAADSVVALGGGSGLDAGKAIAMVARSGLSLAELDWERSPPAAVAAGAFPPVVCVPTTAGTGAEMDSASMYTDTAARVKRCVSHPQATAALSVIADPSVTRSLPADLTAWTGLDALTHALEALSVDSYHPMADAIALEAVALVHEWLPRAVAAPRDADARAHMLCASSMAAVAFHKGLGAVHGLSEPIGAVYDTQHGLTNAIILPYVLRANRHAPGVEQKMARVARALALPLPRAAAAGAGADAGDADAAGFEAVAAWVDDFSRALRVPRSLRDIGVDAASAERIARKARENSTGFTNPQPLSADDYEAIFRAAVDGAPPAEFELPAGAPERARA